MSIRMPSINVENYANELTEFDYSYGPVADFTTADITCGVSKKITRSTLKL